MSTETGSQKRWRVRRSRATPKRESRSRPAPATRPRAHSASGSTGPVRCRSRSAPRASSSQRSKQFAADPQARVHAFCHAVPQAWHAMGVMLSAAGSLTWLHNVAAPDISYDELLAMADAWPAGTENLIFLPYLAGERTPHADPDARGAFAGLSLRHDRGALTRAVLEGVAFGLRDSLDLIDELGEKKPEFGSHLRRWRPKRSLGEDHSKRARTATANELPSTRAPRSARRFSAALPPASGLAFRMGLRRPCGRRGSGSSPTRNGSRSTKNSDPSSRRCTPQ